MRTQMLFLAMSAAIAKPIPQFALLRMLFLNRSPCLPTGESCRDLFESSECLSVDPPLCCGKCLGGLWFNVQNKNVGLSPQYFLLDLDYDLLDLGGCQMS